MSRQIEFLASAGQDLDEAVLWYEAQRQGLGSLLLEEVQRTLLLISESPLAYRSAHRSLRCAKVGRFPYSVVYEARDEHIVVFAVFHARRSPSIWRARA